MSYILEAVRRAEEERREQESPNVRRLQTVAYQTAAHEQAFPNWAKALTLIAGLNIAGWYAYVQLSPEALPTQAVAENSVTAGPASFDRSADLEPKESGQGIVRDVTTAEHASVRDARQLQRMPLWQAPAAAQAAVDKLEFSFHVYAEKPEQRAIIINGQRMTEGERISTELSLREITPNGVLIQFQHLLLLVDVLEQW